MTARQLLAEALVRLYPAAWRREYGPELADILASRPVTARVVVDLLWNAGAQRAQSPAPSTILGVASMLAILGGVVLTPTRYGSASTALLRPTLMTFPPLVVTFFTSELYTVLLLACGCWTQRRYHGTALRSGVAGMRMSVIAGIPVFIAGLLLAVGAIDVSFIGLADLRPSPLAMMIAPLARLPEYWIWGAIGGWLGRRLPRSKSAAPAS
jgi:hypothetical protein